MTRGGRISLTAHEARVVDDALTKFLNWEAVSDEDVEDDHAAQRVIDKIAALDVECPHWEPGRITLRKGCTACAAEKRAPEPHVSEEDGR